MVSRKDKETGDYSLFTVEPLHYIHTGLSKLMKRNTVNQVPSDRVTRVKV